jgi:hypothetical protein
MVTGIIGPNFLEVDTVGLFLGFLAVALVLFLVFAMALAEWADMDPGDLIRKGVSQYRKLKLRLAPEKTRTGIDTAGREESPQPSPAAKTRKSAALIKTGQKAVTKADTNKTRALKVKAAKRKAK